jgi:SpoVK/Ycf46/Vps4 family AAA+-type ATPase
MFNVQNITPGLQHVNFTSSDNDRKQYSQVVYYQQPSANKQFQTINKYEKEQKRQRGLNTAAILVSIGAGLAIIFSVLGRPMRVVGKGGAGSSGGGGHAADAIYKVDLLWKDMKEAKNKVASLDSKTTNKTLKEEFQKLIDNSNLSEKAKKWSGYNDSSELIYLYGYGGTGKTYVAEQYAQEIGALFTKIKYPDLGSSYVDGASIRVNNMFKELEKYANEHKDRQVVVCLDEVDALIRKVDEASNGKENASKIRASVLTGIDELKQKTKNVKIVMTSNYNPESGVIDDVIKRRLNKNIEVKLPDKEQMKALFEMYLKDIEAIKPEFYNTSEFKNFVDSMVRDGYSSGEVEVIAHEASSIFSSKLKNIPDEQLEKHKFMMEYLQKAKQLKGQAASKTNESMKAKKS